MLPRVAEVAARPEDGHPDETGGALRRGEQRSVLRMAELLPKAVTPTVDPGDVLIFDSWVLCVSTMSRPVPPLLGSADMCLGSHRANSNLRKDEFASKIGLVNVYCRPDCQRLDPPDGHKGKEEDELLAHAAEVQRRVAEGGMEGGRDRGRPVDGDDNALMRDGVVLPLPPSQQARARV